jgi:Sec-independent protein secretion pathway component TatC
MQDLKPINEHAKELSVYLIKNLIVFGITFVTAFGISPLIISRLLSYYTINVYALTPLEYIKTQLLIGLALATILTIPILVLSVYFYCKEFIAIHKVYLYIFGSYFLSITGFTIGATIASKGILASLLSITPIETLWSISSVISIVITTSLVLAVTTQLLLLIPLLMKLEILRYKSYSTYRKHLIVGVLFILALITPDPTMFSTSILAIPVFGSIEGGFQIGRYITWRKKT